MKKIILLLTVITVIALTGCSKSDEKAPEKTTPVLTETVTPIVTEPVVTATPIPDEPEVTDMPVVTDEPDITQTEDTGNGFDDEMYDVIYDENGELKPGITTGEDSYGNILYFDENGNIIYAYNIDSDDICVTPDPVEEVSDEEQMFLEYGDIWLDLVKSIPTENDYENDYRFWTREDARQFLIEEYEVPETYADKLLDEYYPLTPEEQTERFMAWCRYTGAGPEQAKETLEKYGLGEYFDEAKYLEAVSVSELISTRIRNMQEELFTISKQNMYDSLTRNGYSDKDIREVIDTAYVIRTDDVLTDYLKNEGLSDEDINAFLERYHTESTLK